MNEKKYICFKKLIKENYNRNKEKLKLRTPIFYQKGLLFKAVMKGLYGYVEILYGPAEYHPEIVIVAKDKKHWSLGDLMKFESVCKWLYSYKQSNYNHETELEHDVEWIFLILTEALIDVPEFEWIVSRK